MEKKIAFENGQISDFQGLVIVTLTLDQVIPHIAMHHSSTSTYIPNFIEIEETFGGRTDGLTFETHFIRPTPYRCLDLIVYIVPFIIVLYLSIQLQSCQSVLINLLT